MTQLIQVDIWSDVACPWCYIGKRRFELGTASFLEGRSEAPRVAVEFHSFQLDPAMPPDFEGDAAQYLARHKGIPQDTARQMQERVSALAAEVGLVYDFDSLRPANTVKAHQLLHFARAAGKQEPMKERLLAAHFLEGRHVGREEVLAELAAQVGLDGEAAAKSLADEEYLEAVRADERSAAALDIRGVPFYVFDRRYAVSGAQPPEVFARVLEQVHSGERGGEG